MPFTWDSTRPNFERYIKHKHALVQREVLAGNQDREENRVERMLDRIYLGNDRLAQALATSEGKVRESPAVGDDMS